MRILLSCVLLALCSLALPALGEPKAYDIVRYRGKAAGLTIALDYASGYPEASKLRVTETRTGKMTRFMLEEEGEMQLRFVPEKNRDRGDEVIFKLKSSSESDDGTFRGVYRRSGKPIPFTLREL